MLLWIREKRQSFGIIVSVVASLTRPQSPLSRRQKGTYDLLKIPGAAGQPA